MERLKIGKLNSFKRRRTNIIDQKEMEERKRTCMKALLNRPWIAKETDAQLYYWIKEDYIAIRDWFMNYTGYSLVLNRKFAKLNKFPEVAFPWMGFQEFREPLDYALFTYSLWYLENKIEGEQFLLTDLVKEIREHMVEQGLDIDWKNYFHRLSMARALKKLKGLDIIQAVDGRESDWANDSETYDVLYNCKSYFRYILRNFPRDFSSYSTLEDLVEISVNDGDNPEAINRAKRHSLYRRFLLEPIVLNWHCKEDALYFHGQKNNLISQLRLMFGLEGSKYKEGVIFFESGSFTECEFFPTLSSISDIALLVCSKVREMLNNTDYEIAIRSNGDVHVMKGEIERILLNLKTDFGSYWINDYRKMKSSDLADIVCQHLEEWGFGMWDDNLVFVFNAVCGRWKVQYGSTELEE